MVYTWDRYGGYECSSRGDKRFSAFYAKLEDGRSIEEHYQCDVKGYASIKEGKGQPPIRKVVDTEYEYLQLWIRWAKLNPSLIEELKELTIPYNGVLSDMFSNKNSKANQAYALSVILNDGLHLGW